MRSTPTRSSSASSATRWPSPRATSPAAPRSPEAAEAWAFAAGRLIELEAHLPLRVWRFEDLIADTAAVGEGDLRLRRPRPLRRAGGLPAGQGTHRRRRRGHPRQPQGRSLLRLRRDGPAHARGRQRTRPRTSDPRPPAPNSPRAVRRGCGISAMQRPCPESLDRKGRRCRRFVASHQRAYGIPIGLWPAAAPQVFLLLPLTATPGGDDQRQSVHLLFWIKSYDCRSTKSTSPRKCHN